MRYAVIFNLHLKQLAQTPLASISSRENGAESAGKHGMSVRKIGAKAKLQELEKLEVDSP